MHGLIFEVGGQAVLGRQLQTATPWLTERHGYDPTCTPLILPAFQKVGGPRGELFFSLHSGVSPVLFLRLSVLRSTF